MNRIITSLALIILMAAPVFAHGDRHGRGMNIHTNREEDGPITRCNQIEITLDNVAAERSEEAVDVGSQRSLRVRGARDGGIYVSGADGGAFGVTVCKAAATPDALARIHASLRGDEVGVDGLSGDRESVAILIVRVPRGASLEAEGTNGPFCIDGVDATVTARVSNGPVSIRESSGSIDVETTNGPISLAGGSGTMKLNATNGPVFVKLLDDSWKGSLEANTTNGPVTLKIPRAYRSGVVVESKGHGPVSCRAEACSGAFRRSEDDSSRLEFGSGAPVVRLSTVNGPVSVKEE